jgi:hypothetical protein
MTELITKLVEVKLVDDQNFLKIKETLTRIGVASKKDNTLYQTCHILHKRGSYYIVHFKELFLLDGKESTLEDSDIARRNTIVDLLKQWNLVEVVNPKQIEEPRAPLSQIKVVSFKAKPEWTLIAKYTVGKKK